MPKARHLQKNGKALSLKTCTNSYVVLIGSTVTNGILFGGLMVHIFRGSLVYFLLFFANLCLGEKQIQKYLIQLMIWQP